MTENAETPQVNESNDDEQATPAEGNATSQVIDTVDVVDKFSSEQEEYERRYEESYDLYDPSYVVWLEANHPDAVRAEWLTSNQESAPISAPPLITTTPVADAHSAGSSPVFKGHGSTKSSPISDSSTACSPVSPLMKFLTPVPTPVLSTSKTIKARVLTSNECIALLEEKEKKKKQETEEKEMRKLEKEQKKKEKMEEQKRKAEERERKAEERRQKAEERKRLAEEKRKIGRGFF